MSELPVGWVSVGICEVSALSPKFDFGGDDDRPVHFVPMSAVAEDFRGVDISQKRPLQSVRKGYTSFAEGDVLFAKITPCMENGKGGIVPALPREYAFGSTEFHVLRPNGAVKAGWLAHFLSQPTFRRLARQNMTGSAGQLRVPSKWLESAKVPVPPLAEQARIVAKLEELLSVLDAGVAELKAAQKKLAQYRQSLLKAAVEGRLTADWRAQRAAKNVDAPGVRERSARYDLTVPTPAPQDARQRGHDDEAETGADLLARILRERRARWEAKQLARFKEQGKTPPKDWQRKYPEPVSVETCGLPMLPDGWVWASLDQLVTESSYGTSEKCSYEGSGVPVLRIPNVGGGDLDLRDMKFALANLQVEDGDALAVGDVLVIRTNGSIGLVGRSAVVTKPLPVPHYFASYLLRLRSVEVTFTHRWIATVLASSAGRRWLEQRAASSAGQHNISLSTLLTMPMPLPPIEEQEAIIEQLGGALSAADEQALAIDVSLKQSTAQRQNILRAAFAGHLVPQDPDDEPAAKLLERIRAERVRESIATKPKRARRAASGTA